MELSNSARDTINRGNSISVVFKNQDGEDVTVWLSNHEEGFSVETDNGQGMMYNESSESFEDLK